jgi:hypothetical protein
MSLPNFLFFAGQVGGVRSFLNLFLKKLRRFPTSCSFLGKLAVFDPS